MDPTCFKNPTICNNIMSSVGRSPYAAYRLNFVSFYDTTTFLLYFGQIPLMGITLIAMLLDLCTRHNFRVINSLLIFHTALTGIGAIVKGSFFNSKNEEIT